MFKNENNFLRLYRILRLTGKGTKHSIDCRTSKSSDFAMSLSRHPVQKLKLLLDINGRRTE